jgi:hypothetical protein
MLPNWQAFPIVPNVRSAVVCNLCCGVVWQRNSQPLALHLDVVHVQLGCIVHDESINVLDQFKEAQSCVCAVLHDT